MKTNENLAPLLEAFFTDRLMAQRQASPHTIASYRDTFRLLLGYAQERRRKTPAEMSIEDLDAPLIVDFLNHLEKARGNGARSRNLRLTAIHSFFRYVSPREPTAAAHVQRVLSIPNKRYLKVQVPFLTRPEIEALLSAPNRTTRGGRRDHALLLLAIQTGLRVSELAQLHCEDMTLGGGAHVRCDGKGRKERCVPLSKQTAVVLGAWLRERDGKSSDPLFPNARGGRLSADGVQYLLAKHVSAAQKKSATLANKRVSPHVLRHSTAMHLLQAGVDQSVIALWLGHESLETTRVYIDADMEMKRKALDRVKPFEGRGGGRYRADDRLLAFLKSL
jgi:site-specific recombinase XerD